MPKDPRRKRSRDIDKADVTRPLAEIFGVEMHFQPEEEAPPVDLDLLGRHIRQELSTDEEVAVCNLIASFRSWHDACTRLMLSTRKKK